MNKLLSAGLTRLKKDKVFWVFVGFMVVMAWFVVINSYLNMKKWGSSVGLENILFRHIMFMGVLTAAFSGLFIGTEYSEGTIRNKLVIGHTRRDIYLSSLIISITAGVIICVSYMLSAMIPGIILLGFSEGIIVEVMLPAPLLIMLMTVAFSAIFTMCGMLNQNKALNCVIAIIGAFVMLMFSAFIFSELSNPEMWEEYVYVDEETGEIVTEPAEPNPFYVSGTKREVYEFLMLFLPSWQTFLIAGGELSHAGEMAAYSVLIVIASSAAGMYFFQKKDIK